jgi:amino acid adenylation domain-containing protein/non-ribosomal peptide synthase protein (TIGR01720 family)
MKADIFAEGLNMEGKPLDLVSILHSASDDSQTSGTGIYYIASDGSERFQTYAELWKNARELLFGLNQFGIKKGDFLIFQLENEFFYINLFWACQLGGIVPVPLHAAMTSENTEDLTKLVNVKEQLNHPLIVTDAALEKVVDPRLCATHHLATISFEALEKLALQPGEIRRPAPGDLALVLFSSGSTGSPKGVTLSHANLIHQIFQINTHMKMTGQDVGAIWTPLTHALALNLLHLPLIGSKSSQLTIAPETFVKKPALFLAKITKHRATFLGCANFALAWILEKVTDAELAKIDLASVRVMIVTAEPISMKIIRGFIARMAKCNFPEDAIHFTYGMSETCAGACFQPVATPPLGHLFDRDLLSGSQVIKEAAADNGDFVEFADVGCPLPGVSIRILDDQERWVEENVIGNILIKGPNVTSGYLNNPQANQELFANGYLRSGDLGMIRNQRLIVTGRKKDVIFFNGQNYYAHDIERICWELEGLTAGNVAVCANYNEQTGKDEMLIFIKSDQKPEQFVKTLLNVKEHVARKIRQTVSCVIPVETIPRTISGKLQRYKLEQQYRSGRFAAVTRELQALLQKNGVNGPPRNEIDCYLIKLWSSHFQQESIGIYDDFFALGGDSLKMMRIIAELSAYYQLELTIGDFGNMGHIAALSDYIAIHHDSVRQTKYQVKTGNPQDLHLPFPVTEVQLAYLMGRGDQFEMGGVSCHYYIELESKLDVKRLNWGMQQLIRRHPMLRAVILPDGRQSILRGIPVYQIEVLDLGHLDREAQQERILKERERMSHDVFPVKRWPLFEIKAFRLGEELYYIFAGFDLLIADATSLHIIAQELMILYHDPHHTFPELGYSFQDFIRVYGQLKDSRKYQADKKYWLDRLNNFPPAPALPLKQEPSAITKPYFSRCCKQLGKNDWERLKSLCRRHDIRPTAVFCTAYAMTLAFWSNQPDLTINLTVSNRYPVHEDIDRIVGDFTSLVLIAIRNLNDGLSFWDQARVVQNTLDEALEHRGYDGVEFIRELSKSNNYGNKAIMPVVLTSLMFGDLLEDWAQFGEVQFNITQTPQLYLDHQIWKSDQGIALIWDYVEQLFEPNVIAAMFAQYTAILEGLLTKVDETVDAACVQTAVALEAEPFRLHDESWFYLMNRSDAVAGFLRKQHEMIAQYNRTEAAIPAATLHHLFTGQAGRRPEQTALAFEGQTMSYRELDERSNRLARYLKGQGIGRNGFVGVLAYRDPRTIVNVMGILKAGAAYVPVDPEYPEERRQYILENSNCQMLLIPEFYLKNRVAEFPADPIADNDYPEDVAYIIYTSGSTGRPKGVVITHAAVANTIIDINQRFNVAGGDRIIGLSSMGFDLSVYDIFGALAAGATLVLIPDVRDVKHLQTVIERERITIWNSVPAIMAMLLENLDGDSDAELAYWQVGSGSDLVVDYHQNDSLRLVLLSGDWIPLGLPDKIKANFPYTDVISLGGATEASIWSIYYPIREIRSEWKSIPYGRPLANQKFYVLNYRLGICPVGVPGELYIGGAGLASGYCNDAAKTANAFIKHPVLGNLYKTGDYGVWRQDGCIEFLGRQDHQVKIRGHRIELGEIESCLLRHEAVKNAVVVDRTDQNGQKYLCGYIVTDTGLNNEELKAHLLKELPEYMVPAYLLPIGEIPLTSNGKVDRKSLPAPDALIMASGKQYVAPRNETERKLAEIWQEVLGLSQVGILDDFLELGGDSIKMVSAVTKVADRFRVELDFREFLNSATINKLAAVIASKAVIDATGKYPAKTGDPQHLQVPFPLTEVQMAYLMGRNAQFEMGGISTHGYFEIETQLDPQRLSTGLNRVIQRQPMLRALIYSTGEQQILAQVPEYRILVNDYSHLSSERQQQLIFEERERMSHAVFTTDQWPLFEFKAFKLSAETHYLFIGFDLLIMDGTSMRILIKEMMDFYRDPQLEPAKLQFSFRDYIMAAQEFKQSETYQRDKAYWLAKLADFPAAPALPLRKEPKEIRNPRFKRHRKIYPPNQWEKLKMQAQEHNITASALLCMAYAQVLAYWSNQPHLAVNVTLFNRYPFHPDVNKILGDFTSLIVLDIEFEPELSFWGQAARVQNGLMEALEHRHYDGVEFIRELSKYHNLSARAVIPVVFTSMLFTMEDEGRGGSLADFGTLKTGISQTSQVYLDYQAAENRGELAIVWDYVEELFDPAVIDRMFAQYTAILDGLIQGWEYRLEVDEAVKRFVERYNRTEAVIPATTLHRLFTGQAERTPEQTALVFDIQTMSYRELDERSNRMARYLKQRGIGRNDLVGVLAYRDPRTIVNVMGILKAGAAYVPVDPEYPRERQEYILENSNCKMLLIPEFYRKNRVAEFPAAALDAKDYPEDVAYVIYTSGSAGRPKGVVITHAAVANTIIDINQRFNIAGGDRIIGLSSMGFDLSVYDIFGALAAGATLVLIPDVRDVKHLQTVVERERITIWNSVPAIMDLLVGNVEEDFRNRSLRVVLLSGDWIPLKLPAKIRQHFENAAITSLGGATEASIWSIYYPVKELRKDWKSIPYGMPLANQKFYVLNYRLELCPVGVAGELYIGGVGLAGGYFNDPEKTGKAFIKHPALGDLYQTGDYGVWRQEGYIEFMGRKDRQVKIRGHRIELGEIESRMLEHPRVRKAAVIDRSGPDGKKYLCGYAVMDELPDAEDLRKHLAGVLPDYMIPTYFVQLDRIPLTPNGKVDLKSLPEPVVKADKDRETPGPRNEIEAIMVQVWQNVLGVEEVNIKESFFALGGDSIKAIQISARLRKHGLKLEVPNIFAEQTIEKISEKVRKETNRFDQGIVQGEVALIPIQKWFFAQKLTRMNHWNQAFSLYRKNGFDAGKLRQVFDKILEHHDALRSVFMRKNEDITQYVRGMGEGLYTLEVFDFTGQDQYQPAIVAAAEELQSQIDLENGPLVKLGLFKSPDGDYLVVIIHHLVVDGVSWRILFEDIAESYRQAEKDGEISLPPKSYSLKNWADELYKYANSGNLLKEVDFWSKLTHETVGRLPQKPGVSANKIKNSRSLVVSLSDTATDKLLKNVHQAYNTEINEILLAALGMTLYHWTGLDRFLINLEGHGRENISEGFDHSRIVGWFTSIHPVLIANSDSENTGAWIKSVKDILRRIPNKGVGYGILKYITAPENTRTIDFGIKPEINFIYLGQFGREAHQEMFEISTELTGASMAPDSERACLIDIVGMIIDGKMTFRLIYNQDAFDAADMSKVAKDFGECLASIVHHCENRQETETTVSDFEYKDLSADDFEAIVAMIAEVRERKQFGG